MQDPTPLEAAIAALEQQRGLLGHAVVDAALGPMRERLAQLRAAALGASQAAPAQTRRQVSVLFLDVVGSTALSSRLDPEDVHAVIDHVLALCTDQVRQHGGRVLQYAGDNLLAAFGADGAQEDDAERAVHCALALLQEGRALRERVRHRHQHDGVDVRVGIHTGPVLLGGGVDDEGSIRGLAVNIAARMEQTAPVGALRISHDTWLLVRGAFEVQVQPLLQVKGSNDLLQTYLVQRALPSAQRVAARGLQAAAPLLVGREAEAAQVRGLPGLALQTGRLQAITLMGEPGVGKSRLLLELQAGTPCTADTPSGPWLMLGRANAASRLQPYGLLRNLLAWQLQLQDSAPLEQAKAQLVGGLLPWLTGSPDARLAHAHALGQIIGLDFGSSVALHGLSPNALRQRAFAALTNHLRTLGIAGRVPVLLLEDLHWADDASLDFVQDLLQDAAAPPVALLATARPELLERRPGWGQLGTAHSLLPLDALAAPQAQALAASLLAQVQGSAGLQQRLVTLSDGNPFFMEELVRMCLDQGVIVQDPQGAWQVLPDQLGRTRMPTTLVGVLQARLDGLPPAQRSALQQASIVGHVFWDQALAALDATAPAALTGLHTRLLVQQRRSSSFDDTPEEAFRHHLLHQVTYDTVLRTVRAAGHAATADWLAQRMGDRPAEFLAITALHYERAGRLPQAAEFYERAAHDAIRRAACSAALEHAGHGLRCVPAADLRRRYALHAVRETAADALGQRSVQDAEILAGLALATELGDAALQARSCFAQALLASRRGDEKQAMALATQAAALATAAGDAPTAAIAQAQMAWSHYTLGDGDQALQMAQSAVAHARSAVAAHDTLATRTQRVKLLSLQGVVLAGQGSYAAAGASYREALQGAVADGLHLARTNLYGYLGNLECEVGRYTQALGYLQQALQGAMDLDMLLPQAATHYNMASAQRALGRADLAWHSAEEAGRCASAAEMREVLARSWLMRGHLLADAGRTDAAHAAYDTAARGFEDCALPHFASQAYAGRASLALAAGDMAAARDWAERTAAAIAGVPSLLGIDEPALPSLCCWRVWQRLGDPRAAAALQRALDDVQTAAGRVDDPALRQAMLQQVPMMRDVMAAWAATHGA
jgi:predicted ATPase/class 3 adenylate cyclase